MEISLFIEERISQVNARNAKFPMSLNQKKFQQGDNAAFALIKNVMHFFEIVATFARVEHV